jgi:hypothetical protein
MTLPDHSRALLCGIFVVATLSPRCRGDSQRPTATLPRIEVLRLARGSDVMSTSIFGRRLRVSTVIFEVKPFTLSGSA